MVCEQQSLSAAPPGQGSVLLDEVFDQTGKPLPLSEAGQPTNALPGSKAKIKVMAERHRLGLPIFHPLDPVCEMGAVSHPNKSIDRAARPLPRGVIWCAQTSRYRARPYDPRTRKVKNLGRYKTVEEAEAVVLAWRKRHEKDW